MQSYNLNQPAQPKHLHTPVYGLGYGAPHSLGQPPQRALSSTHGENPSYQHILPPCVGLALRINSLRPGLASSGYSIARGSQGEGCESQLSLPRRWTYTFMQWISTIDIAGTPSRCGAIESGRKEYHQLSKSRPWRTHACYAQLGTQGASWDHPRTEMSSSRACGSLVPSPQPRVTSGALTYSGPTVYGFRSQLRWMGLS